MPRRLIKKYLPPPHRIREEPVLKKIFGKLLHENNLWHLNRRSVTAAVAIGSFFALIPLPLQTVIAVLFALWLRANLPITVLLVWTTNPLTMGPVFFFAYKLGHWLLDLPPSTNHFEANLSWLMSEIHRIWKPLFLGSGILAVTASSIGYTATNILWRMHVIKRWKARKWGRRKKVH